MSVNICTTQTTTRLIFLGSVCDTALRRFEVLESKQENLEALLENDVDDDWTSATNLEKLTGKCTSMSVAVPPASLYTYHMYKKVTQYQYGRGVYS